jgi:hypothetical protein
MCTVLLPPGDNRIAVNKHIISYHGLSYVWVCQSKIQNSLKLTKCRTQYRFIHVFTVHHFHFHFLIPTGALRSLWFFRSLFQHYVLKHVKHISLKHLLKNICGPSLKLQQVSDNVYPSSGSWSVLDWNCRWFPDCISVVSVVLVVRLDSFDRAWHLSYWSAQHSTKQHQQNINQPEQNTRQMPGSAKRV